MGVDAKLVVVVKGKEKPSDEQIAVWGDRLCRSIGAKHFFISDGLPQPEYERASKAWHAAFEAHPLYQKWRSLSDPRSPFAEARALKDDIHKRIFADIGESPKQLRRAVELTNTTYPITDDDEDEEDEYGERIPAEFREPGRCYLQDGPPVFTEPGEWLLSVSLWTRFYGPGYERGDILIICAVAEWFEHNIPGCAVMYGGDSSGMVLAPFGPNERAAMRAHLYGAHGRDYFQYDRRGSFPAPKPCGLCIGGKGEFDRYGWGDNYVAVGCAGCGKSFTSRDGGKTWETEKQEH